MQTYGGLVVVGVVFIYFLIGIFYGIILAPILRKNQWPEPDDLALALAMFWPLSLPVVIGGFSGDRLSIHSLENGERLAKNAKPIECRFRSYNSWRWQNVNLT